MIEKLFSSGVMFSLLLELFRKKDANLSTAELTRLTNKKQPNIKKELDKLLAMDIVIKETKNNNNYYRLNQKYNHFKVLESFFDAYLKNDKSYILFNEEDGISLLSLQYIIDGFASDYAVKEGILSFVPEMFTHFKNNYIKFYMEEGEVKRLSTESFNKLKNNPSFVFDIIKPVTLKYGAKAQEIFARLKKNDFRVDKKIAATMIDNFKEIVAAQSSYNMIAVLELQDYIYSNYLKSYLKEKTAGTSITLNYALEKLLAPEELTYTQILKSKLLEAAIAGKSSEKTLPKLHNDWAWLNFGYRGPGLDYNYFTESFKELKNKNATALREELEQIKNYPALISQEKNKIFKKLGIDIKHRNFINALSLLSYLKVYRKDIAFLINYCTLRILKPFQKKIKDLYYLTLEEAQELINGRLKISSKTLQARETESFYHSNTKQFIVGPEVNELLDRLPIKKQENAAGKSLNLLEGTTASLGETGNWVYGEAKIINTAKDMGKMNEGDILISVATTPDILLAMKKAAAIVTDHGGITCHAAIVSRELKKPCLIGTKYATKIFKDGDKVIVCPRHGYIKFQ